MFLPLFCTFLFTHAVADYWAQSDFIANAKNRTRAIPGHPWWIIMGAHATIHGGLVGIVAQLVAGMWWIGILEAVAHFIIDDAKCRGKIGFITDQALHVACKIVWILIIASLI